MKVFNCHFRDINAGMVQLNEEQTKKQTAKTDIIRREVVEYQQQYQHDMKISAKKVTKGNERTRICGMRMNRPKKKNSNNGNQHTGI